MREETGTDLLRYEDLGQLTGIDSLFEQTTLTSFSFIPFGKGAHTCLGMQFANMEIKAVLYRLLLKYRLRIQKSQTLELDYLPIVRPKKGMTIIFESLPDDG